MIQGIGRLIGTAIFGTLDKKVSFGRDWLVCAATISNLISYFLVYLNFPVQSTLQKTDENGQIQHRASISLACGFIFGLCDACLNRQISSLLISHFCNKNIEAFSLFKFFQV